MLRHALRALKTAELPDGPAFTFNCIGAPMGSKLIAGDEYHLALILPKTHGQAAIEAIARDWAQRRPPQHFGIIDLGEPQPRSLAQLIAETPQPPSEVLQLTFHTPLEFDAVNRDSTWVLDPAQFQRMMTRAIRALCPAVAMPRDAPLADLRLDSHYWKLQRHTHRAQSQPGQQLITGWQGPLLVRGDWQARWAELLLAQEFHLGPGKPLGQGHFTLGEPQPILDPRFASEGFVRQTWQQLQDDQAPFAQPLTDPGQEAAALTLIATALRAGTWTAGEAQLIEIEKRATPPPLTPSPCCPLPIGSRTSACTACCRPCSTCCSAMPPSAIARGAASTPRGR